MLMGNGSIGNKRTKFRYNKFDIHLRLPRANVKYGVKTASGVQEKVCLRNLRMISIYMMLKTTRMDELSKCEC